jgi:DNA-binding transcriptional MerR regulator
MIDDNPLYNLKAVCKQTGLNPATLRAWERRYGLIIPKRSEGGHRLYTRHDVELLKWLVDRQKEGLSIRRAVEMWKQSGLSEQSLSPQIPQTISSTTESIIDNLRDQWIKACLAFDDEAANQVLQQAFAIAPPEIICMRVLQKGLMLLGEGWYEGSVTVQQEHFASAIAIRRLNTLIIACAAPKHLGSIMVACPPGEEHDFILLLVTFLLRRSGWSVLYLGANVPLANLDKMIKSTRTSLVISAAQTLISAASLRQMSDYLLQQDVPLAFGGRIFQLIPKVTGQISGYYLGEDISSVPQLVEHLMVNPPQMPLAGAVSTEYLQTLAEYTRNQTAINVLVLSSIPAEVIPPVFLEIALSNFSSLITAALSLGNIHFIESSVTWLEGLLNNYAHERSEIIQFYKGYRAATEHILGDKGSIILDWLSTIDS